jgi:phosphopantetheine--protein transferase-like protein
MIGIDLVSIVEFQRQLDLGGESFLRKAFTDSELENRQVSHVAGLWAAKEAVVKAAGIPAAKLTDVVVSYDASGRPHGTLDTHHFELSISHHGDYAVAVALMVTT